MTKTANNKAKNKLISNIDNDRVFLVENTMIPSKKLRAKNSIIKA
ncbi:hypothetical protein CRYPA_1508 [uncultured Candidatus Thioglobus sp.]|nr:hypothetical protein CRYPA_1508 [uncultured Candidatus Thioglobus sp.]